LEQAARATAEITKTADNTIVNVMATAGFTTYWLMPNIGSFRQKHPDVELRFVISDTFLDLRTENIDVAIRYADPPFPGYNAELLVREVIAPTCAPGLIEGLSRLLPHEIVRYPLIDLDGPYDEQTRWQHWFRGQGLEWRGAQGGITVNTYTNLVQAALDGQGFALIGTPLIKRFLTVGSLVQPVDAPPVQRRPFCVVTASDRRSSNVAKLFCSWIRDSFSLGSQEAETQGGIY
jgi:DNA-binding transcriptional LysR family regulator